MQPSSNVPQTAFIRTLERLIERRLDLARHWVIILSLQAVNAQVRSTVFELMVDSSCHPSDSTCDRSIYGNTPTPQVPLSDTGPVRDTYELETNWSKYTDLQPPSPYSI